MEQILESIPGWTWDVLEDKWNEGFYHLKEFKNKFSHINFSQKHKTEDGFKLGQWVGVQRSFISKMSKERKNKLDSLGFVWDSVDQQWEKGYSHLTTFFEKEGHAVVSYNYITGNGYKLGSWVRRQRSNKEKMSKERKNKLNLLGFDW